MFKDLINEFLKKIEIYKIIMIETIIDLRYD